MGSGGLEYLLKKNILPSLVVSAHVDKKRVTFHPLRHSLEMNRLRRGVDRSVMILWLRHENMETTSIYL